MPPHHPMTAFDEVEEWAALPVLDGRSIVRTRELLFKSALRAKPPQATRIESGVEQIAGHRGAHQREARSIHPLADPRKDADLVGTCQRCSDDPVADL